MPQTDEFGKHEALHTTHIIASVFEDFVLNHGAVQADQELKVAAEKISERLADFYQLCGRKFPLATK